MSHLRTFLLGGLLCGGLGLHPALAITGCSNIYLQGTYNAQVSNASFTNLLDMLNGGTTGAVTATPPANTVPAFPGSLLGGTSPLGRYYFDGNGNVLGIAMVNTNGGLMPANAVVGSYSVDTYCNAKISLNGGRSFNGVITNQGQTMLFLESDSSGRGATGLMQRSAASCTANDFPASFGFTFFGAQPVGSSVPAAGNLQSVASVGSIQLDGAGNFTMTSWVLSGGSVRQANNTGTYTIQSDCSLKLNFASRTATAGGGSTGDVAAPVLLNGLISGAIGNNAGGTGLLSVQALDGSSVVGQLFVQ